MVRTIRLAGLIYHVCGDGFILKRRGDGFLKPFPDKDGYLKVVVCKDGKSNNFFLHRIIYEAFNGPIPEGMTVDHIDSDKLNNHKDNLQLLNVVDNVIKGNARVWKFLNPEGELVEIYNLRAFCREHGLHKSHMYSVHNEHPLYKQYKGWRKYYE